MSQNGHTSLSGERIEELGVEALTEWLQSALIEWPEGGNSYFLPIDTIELLENRTVVRNILREMFPDMNREIQSHYVESISYRTTRILAILLHSSTGIHLRAIQNLIDEGISDRDLPFARVHTDDMNSGLANSQSHAKRRYTLGRRDHDFCDHERHDACGIKTFAKWHPGEVQNLCRDQWTTLSPVFEQSLGDIYHYTIADAVTLPFIYDQEMVKGGIKEGGYSEVWPIRIHPAHQNILRSSDPSGPLIAVKRLKSRDLTDFENEREMLKSLTLKGHPHLVKLLSTYTYKGYFHFLCPFAQANLRDYWKSTPVFRDVTTYFWTLTQLAGLASGLHVIHDFATSRPLGSDHVNSQFSGKRRSLDFRLIVDPAEEMFGRHGDLKPENILWFNDLEGFDDSGVLQIADLGLGRFHRLESRSRQDPKTITGSPTYIPPELPLEKWVSRAYDIWSLGCIFLEFVTWLLEGAVGLKNFGEARFARAHDGVYDDTFYMIINTDSGRKFGQVREGVANWIQRLRRDHSYSGMVLELLAVIETQMLRVDAEERVKADVLYLLLNSMLEKGRGNPVYLLGVR